VYLFCEVYLLQQRSASTVCLFPMAKNEIAAARAVICIRAACILQIDIAE
jgi:hypothetical protein